MKTGKVICDGRGNAGTGARAAVLYSDGERHEKAEKLTPCTNIVAEHLAIQLAMELAYEHGVTHLEIWNDSQTPVGHCLGVYQVEAEHLKPIVEATYDTAELFEEVNITWVPREETKEADRLCRQVDRPTPTVFSPFSKSPKAEGIPS